MRALLVLLLGFLAARGDDCELSPTEKTWCVVSEFADPHAVGEAMDFICGHGVNCTACPESQLSNWAFNAYFQKHWKKSGAAACDFNGAGKLTWSDSSPCRPQYSEKNWCVPKPGVSDKELGNAIGYVCSTGKVDCSTIEAGSECLYPEKEEAYYKAAFAFDAFFNAFSHKERKQEACVFRGAATITWPANSSCRLNQADSQWCVAKPNVKPNALAEDIGFLCGIIDCSMIGGGECIFPVESETNDKANWVYNHYYQAHKNEGKSACDFGGHSQLVDPSTMSPLELASVEVLA